MRSYPPSAHNLLVEVVHLSLDQLLQVDAAVLVEWRTSSLALRIAARHFLAAQLESTRRFLLVSAATAS